MNDPINDPVKEQLSAFLDGGLPPREAELLLRRLGREPTAVERQCARYRLIGEAMRVSRDRAPSSAFVAAVRASIAAETLPSAGRRDVRRAAAGWLRPVAGLAVAAGVAAIAILGLRVDTPEEPLASSAAPPLPELAGTNALLGTAPGGDASSYVVPAHLGAGPPVVATRLTNYVVAHSEFSSPLGRRNVLTGLLSDSAVESNPPADPDAAAADPASGAPR